MKRERPGEAAKFSVGQNGSPADLLTLIHSRASRFFHYKLRGNHCNRQTEPPSESKTHQIRRMDRCDSTFRQRSYLFFSSVHPRGADSGGTNAIRWNSPRLPTFADVLHNLRFTSFPILSRQRSASSRIIWNERRELALFWFLVGAAFLVVGVQRAN